MKGGRIHYSASIECDKRNKRAVINRVRWNVGIATRRRCQNRTFLLSNYRDNVAPLQSTS